MGSDRSEKKKSKKGEPLWIINAYMGGNPSKYHFIHPEANSEKEAYIKENFWMNDECGKENSAPLIVLEDINNRWYGLNGKVGKKRTFAKYRMTLGAFYEMLRSYLRWGYVVGKSDVFKFHFFLFINDDLQKSTNSYDEEDEQDRLRFINCQASVAMSALWWMREAGREGARIDDGGKSEDDGDEDDYSSSEREEVESSEREEVDDVEVIAEELSSLVFPRVTYKHNLKGVPLKMARRRKKRVQKATAGVFARRRRSTGSLEGVQQPSHHGEP